MGKYWWEEDDNQATNQQKPAQQNNQSKGYWWEDGAIANTVSTKITNSVNSWLKNHDTYVSDYQNRYSGRKGTYEDSYVSDSGSWLSKVSQQKSKFDKEADSILAYMDQYKDYLDADWMDNVRNAITGVKADQQSIYDIAVNDNQWWSNFKDEEDYNFWQHHNSAESRQKWYAEQEDKLEQLKAEKDKDEDIVSRRAEELYKTGKYTSMLHATEDALKEYNDEIAAIEADLRNYELGNFYNEDGTHYGAKVVDDYSAYIKKPDFNAVSSNRNIVNPTRTDLDEYDSLRDSSTWDYDENGILRDAKGNEIRQDASGKFVNPKANDYAVKDRLGIYLGATDDEREEYAGTIVNGTWGDIIGQGIEGSWDQLEEDEIKIYYYLLNKEGKESADKYLSDMKTELNRRETEEKVKQYAQEYDQANFLGKVAMNAATVPSNLLGGIAGAAENASHMIRGEDINPYSSAHTGSHYSNTVRGEAAKDLDVTIIPWLDFTLGDAYQAGMSILDSFAAIGIGGQFGGALLATNAANSEATRLYEQGATKEQIALGAAAAGAAEMIFESLSIDKLINMKDAKKLGQIIKNALVQGGVEASEEGFTEIANILTNSIIMGDQSDWNKLVEKYNGDTFSAFMEKVKDVVNASLSGFISGVGSSAGPSFVSYAANKLQQNADAKQRYGDNQAAFVEESLMIDADNAYAKKLQSKLKDGKDLSGRQLRKLEEKNASTLKKRLASSVQETAKKRLTDLGETENVDNVAKLVSKLVMDEEMTRSERSTLARSQFGSKVAKDIKENGLEYESPATYKSIEDRVGTESKYNVSKSGQATIQESGEAFDIKKAEVVSFTTDKATGEVVDVTFKTEGGTEVQASGIDFEDDDQSHLVEAVSNIENITPKDAQDIIRDYDPSSGQTVSEYLNGMDEGFTYGYHGYSVEDLKAGNFAPKLSSTQMMSAYELGKAARRESTTASDAPKVKMRTAAEAKLTAEQKLAKQKASIESDDVEVYFQDGKSVVKFDEHGGKYDDKRMAAVNTAKFLSKLKIGGKYYFFESYVNKAGDRVYKDSDGNEVAAPNGMFKDSDGSIHIDLNAGDAGNGIALFTLGHELSHFIKAQSKSQFKILCDLVKEAFDKTELSMRERVLEKQKFLKDVRGEDVSYDEAYEEVVADAMSTMITDGNFHEKLMEIRVKHKDLFSTIKRFFDKMIAEFKKVYEKLTPDQKDARDIREVKDMFDKIQTAFAEALVEASDNFQAAMESVTEENAEAISADETITDGAVVTDGNGERLSIRSMKHDIAEGKMFEDLKSVCGWTDSQVNTLRTQLKDLVEYMIPYRDILDMNESYGMEGRRFSPYKPNSDPLYKISMDFSTLCSKRLLTQYVIEQLQLRENRPMSAEEQMAIRDMLNEYRKVEKGLQVACAMCYVEAARLKSPKQIQRWLDDPTPHLINYFALKNTEFNASVKKAQADFKESKGYDRNAPKKDMKQSDVTALNKIGPKMRSQYQPSAEEKAIIERAKTLPNETYLTAGNLADLSEKESVIYDAYTSFVRTATRSKSLESDEPYYYGDSTRDNGNGIIVTDSFIEAVNRENGMRFSSWSDWRIQHLLDYITAVIDNSVRGAAMHGYTKFGDEVRVLGKTGMMFNMSGVAGTQNGLNEDGSLNFSPTESIDVNEAIQLRDEYPDTAGLQCIGVSNDHIIALLRSDIIDYVIPYHVSGLNAALRRMADIHGWQDYTSTQHAAIDKSSKLDDAVDKEHWHEEPVFSEFFVGYDTGMTGIEAMKASAEKYKQMCKDRGLTPKFNQFANEDNYWKLLIDRKMINQQTGNLIRQKAVTPTFDFDTIKGVVDRFVDNYDAGLEARALNHIVENWDSIPQRIKDLKKKGSTNAKKTTKSVNTLANQTVAAQPKDGTKNSDRISEGYDTRNLAWAIESGVIDESDQARFWQAIAEIKKLHYNSFARTKNGAYIIETNDKMMFTDGDFKAPTLSKVICFTLDGGKEVDNTRRMIRDEAERTGRTDKSVSFAEGLYGSWFIAEYNARYYHTDARQDGQGERNNSQGTATKGEGRGVRHGGTDGLLQRQNVGQDFLANDQLKGNYTVSEISEMFDAWNSDPELRNLSKLVFAKLQEIMDGQKKAYWATPYPIRFKSEAYLQKGYYLAPSGTFEPSSTDSDYGITYNLDYFRKVSDQEKAHVLLHEAIHACTVGVIKSTERRIPKNADPMLFNSLDGWSEEQKAGLELIQVFSQVRVANERNEYGQKNVYEMVAEMSNPEFRAMLKKERLWNRIVDAIKRIFGIEQRTAYEAVSNALDKILELDMAKTEAYRYSERASNKELAQADDTALYIKNTDKANYIGMIFNGAKTEETRSRRTLDAFIGKDFYVTDGKYVYGSIVLGEPHKYTEEEFHKKKNQLKHRVPVGDEYDIKPGGTKWAYPIESYKKFDKPKKLSDSTEYKNSFQARQVKFSDRGTAKLDQAYMDAVNRGDMETAQRLVDHVAFMNGYIPVTRYHQTASRFTQFNTDNPVAGLNDSETPNGIFFKSNNHDIGIGGEIQMELYLKAENMLHFADRKEANAWYCQNVPGYDSTQKELDKALKPFLDRIDAITEQEWDPTKSDDEIDALFEEEDRVIKEMGKVEDSYLAKLRKLLDQYFLHGESGYDGIELDYDGHRWVNGKREDVHTFIVFHPSQAKSANPVTYDDSGNIIPLSERFKKENNDIRYSERGEGSSNRSLLANAFEGIVRDSVEYKQIQKYKANVDTLNVLERQLSDINEEIREETDAKKRATLQEKAERIANDINKQDKVLLNLEASEPLRKIIERERKKEAQNVKEHVNEIVQNKKLRAEQTELRHKIRKTIRDLDKILNRGNKNRNVKEDLQPVVTKALQAAEILFTENYGNYDMLRNGIGADLSDAEEALVATCARMLRELDKMPTDGYDNFMARQEAENRLKSKMYNLKDVFARERKRLNNTKVSFILGELADAYASLEDSDQSYVQGAYSEPVHTFLKNLQNEVGGTIVHDMTKDQLESVYAAYKMVLNTVRNANKMFNEELKQSREQLGNAVIEEVLKAGGVHLLGTKMGDAISQADWNNMKPIWVANRIGSESFAKLMQGLFDGQYNFAVDINEVKQFKLSMDKKYNPRNWDAEKLYQFESSTGKEFNLNLQQIMSLYAFSKREQAYSHLLNGGFVFEDNSTVVVDGKLGIKKTYIHKGATSYKLNEDTLNSIINSLTDEQKAYVDEMQKYLSDVMGAKGNEVSMQLYGIKMFNEEFYFPLRSSGDYMERAKEAELKKQQGQINLVNSGFTHSVKPQAKNPIILSDFMDVWAEHCNEMSMYHSMVLPMEDFRKVYNYSTPHEEGVESYGVYASIKNAYGSAATSYIDQLYKELNAGATVDPRETPWKKLISNFKKTAVMLSGSVVVQQFSSLGRSFAIIDPKYFVGAKVNSDTKLSAVEEMKKYAPVAIIKEMGGFDTGTKGNAKSYIMSEHYEKGERISGLLKDEQYRGDIMGFLPAWADQKTWCAIWEAAKRETKANNSDMNVKSEEFLKLAGERFSEVIEKTQVYDSVLARSANMRSKGNFMAMATAFMAEPTTTVNLLEDAIRRGNKKYIARAFGSVAVAIVLNNALASLVYAMRDDDEDETFIEKYFQSFTSGMIDDINPMTYYPFLKDVYSLFQGYDVERTDMSVIADLRDALKKTISVIGKDTANMDDDKLAKHYKTVNSAILSLLDAGCSVFGVPIKNVRREANGIINAWNTISKDLSGERNATWRGFWDNVGSAVKDTVPIYAWTKDKSKQDKLYEAIISGDKTYVSRLKAGYKDDTAYNSAVRKALRENDPRIHEAAQARYNGNIAECKRIYNEIKNEGKFNSNDILEAINSEESKIRNEEKPETVSSSYSSTDFVNAVIVGDTRLAATMKDDIISAKVANGKSQEEAEESFTTSVSSATRDAFDSSLLNEAGAKKMLREYADMGEEETASRVTYWAVAKAYPKYRNDLNESRVKKYNEFAKPAGISMDVFVQYLRGISEVEDKRDQVLEVIDSLPLTWQQKDALYLAAGYAESKIWDVPW